LGIRLSTLLAKLVDQLPDCAVFESESVCDILLWLPFDKHSSQCFITAVVRVGCPCEEFATESVFHDGASRKMSVGFLAEQPKIVTSDSEDSPGIPSPGTTKQAKNQHRSK
jgi:hypothetical protein